MEDDVVGLPLTRLAGGVDQRGVLAVDRSGLAVEVGFVLIRVEDLQFVPSLQNNSAVAPALAFTAHCSRSRPLDMQLAIPEGFPGTDAAGPVDSCHSVLDLPAGLAPAFALPLRQITAIKKDDGVGRRWPWINDTRLFICSAGC